MNHSRSKSVPISRRSFSKGAVAALAAPMFLPRSAFAADDKFNLAWIGLGAQGSYNLGSCARHANVVAVCEVDQRSREAGGRGWRWKKQWVDFEPGAKAAYPGVKIYKDFRKMFLEMGDKIDAVGISTHDSCHFAAACMAIEMGKHVFIQKPLAHSIYEIRTLQQMANEKKVITQMGNQGHAFEGMRLIKEWYQAGLIGDVEQVVAWTNRPADGIGFKNVPTQTQFPPVVPAPKGLDWDLWMGPVDKEVGYSKLLHPFNWRSWWDFGCGGLGDIGCHTIDAPFWALDLGYPTRVDVEVEQVNPVFTPEGSVVTYHFPARDSKPPVTLKWYEGPKMPPQLDILGDVKLNKEGGMLMIGSKGAIYHPGMRPNSPRLFPETKWQEYRTNPDKRVPKTLPRVDNIFVDWINGVKTGSTPCSNFNYSAPLTEVIVLGTMAIRTGKAIEWDSKAMKVTNDNPEAARLVDVPARAGWRKEDLTKTNAGKYIKA